jgi:hypothetical protein
MTDDEYHRQTNNSLRAIGRYVVEFSELISSMRRVIAQRLTWGHQPLIIGELALGEATASQIADVFFGMCREMGKPDGREAKVESALRKAVKAAIEKRNDIAHGDWSVGVPSDRDEYVEPAILVRYRPLRAEGIQKAQSLSVVDLDALSESLIVLGPLVQDYGILALGLWAEFLGERAERRNPGLDPASVRVRDVLVWDGERVTRTGPLADKIGRLVYFGSTTTPSV